MRRLRNLLINLGLLLASLTLSLAALLWLLPYLLPEPVASTLPDYGALVSYDPARSGGHLRAGVDSQVQGERGGQGVRWHTDSHGFRIDGELSATPPPGRQRIFLLGDSYVDGMRTDQSQTIGALLEQQLRSAGRDVEVVISGHNNPANSWYWLDRHSADFHPDQVIVGITLGNDIIGLNLGYGVVPSDQPGHLRLGPDPTLLDGDPLRLPSLLPDDAYTPPSWLADAWNAREFAAREWLAARTGGFAAWVPAMTGPFENAPRHVFDRDLYTATGQYFVPANAFIEFSYASLRDTLVGIDTLMRERRVAWTVVVFPIRLQVDKAEWRLFKRRYALDGQRFDLRAPNKRIAAVCAEFRLDCVDPTEPMAAHYAAGGESLYRPRGDMHFNEAGNALVARVLAEHWLARKAL